MTPWAPQRSGVADFSTTIFTELAALADVTVYSTSSADIGVPRVTQRSMTRVFEDPDGVSAEHDVLISVVGNSHFHLPMIQALERVDAIVVAHDTRMVEFYLALRGEGGAASVLQRTCDPAAPRGIHPPLEEQVTDMRLLQNAGMWEVARRSSGLVLHSPMSRDRIKRETGVTPVVLPFANQRVPKSPPTAADRHAARLRVGLEGLSPDTVILGTFGYVDIRTKLTDVVLEAAGWLTAWGRSVVLTVVGAASDQQRHDLSKRARRLGLAGFSITGFQTEDQFRDWLLAIDLGVQLRISPLLGVSGPLSDLAAFGTPAVASAGLCADVGTPDYIEALPDDVSPVIVAEGIESALARTRDPEKLELARREYIDRMSSAHYARRLLSVCEELLS
jgi:glycosyltransferase involved in cell wall biosynthesis